MGPGHLGIAFATKPVSPDIPLWALLVASEVLDILSFGFEAVGLEEFAVSETTLEHGVQILIPGSVPWSHGLFMSIIWSLLFAAIAYLISKNHKSSIIIGLVVFSHWILDFIVHPPDLPLLFEGSPVLGLGLWTSHLGFIASIFLEIGLFVTGIVIYILWRKNKSVQE